MLRSRTRLVVCSIMNTYCYSRSRLYSFFFFSSRRRHTRFDCDWSSDVCSSDLLLPLDGAIPLGWSLDHAGPLTRTIEDAGFLLDALSGGRAWKQAGRVTARGLRVGILHDSILQPLQPGVSRQLQEAAAALGRSGLRVRDVRIPEMAWTVVTQLVTLRAEASAAHARWIRDRPRAYGPDVRVRLQLGALVAGADYVLAQRMRARIKDAVRRIFDEIDLLLLPTTPITAPIVGERSVHWRTGAEPGDGALVRLTAPFNLTGGPALSVPYGEGSGVPVGLQLVGRRNHEGRGLAGGRASPGPGRMI